MKNDLKQYCMVNKGAVYLLSGISRLSAKFVLVGIEMGLLHIILVSAIRR